MTATTTSSTRTLPVPRPALLELGLTDAQIDEALDAAPLVLACQAADQPGAFFDVGRARHALDALSRFRHTKGRWAGKRLRLGEGLDPWQVVWIIAPIFGWMYFDDEAQRIVRVIRSFWVEVPRKNGKSTLASGLLLVLLLADREPGAEVYAAANGKLQAGRVFDDAKRMALTASAVRRRVQVLKELIRVAKTDAIMRVLSRIAETAHGLNVHAAIVDEVHTLRLLRGLVEAIETGTGARDQPLVGFITTADEDEEGTIYDEKHNYTRKVADRVVADPAHYGVIWAAEKTDDPMAEATWRKANPGLGISPTLAYMRREAKKAAATPSYLPAFCRLHLNRRERGLSRLIDLADWDACAGDFELGPGDERKRRAWGGLDLSAVSDFTAWWLGVESPDTQLELDMLWRFWIPEDRVEQLERHLQVPLASWIAQGWIRVTEGNVIDYEAVKTDVLADCQLVDMQRISYDRMFAGQMVQEIDAALKGVQVVPVAQTFLGLSPGIKELQRLLGVTNTGREAGRMRHRGDPVARWMASVVESKDDGQDNLKLVKPERAKSQARIDGMSALVNGLDGYLRRPVKKKRALVVMR